MNVVGLSLFCVSLLSRGWVKLSVILFCVGFLIEIGTKPISFDSPKTYKSKMNLDTGLWEAER